ncbi:MAG: MFS transporter [Acetobacterales bacterium]
MRLFHQPVWLGAVGRPGATSLATLYATSTFYRALLITVLPLLAHRLLGDAQKVSVFYFVVSCATVVVSLSIPMLVRRFTRRWVLTFGGLAAPAGMALLASGEVWGLVLGMPVYVFGNTCVELCINLYVLEHVQRKELARFEPKRIFFAAGAWVVGPGLGVWLAEEGLDLVFALSAAGAFVMLAYFWFLRLADHPAVPPMRQPPPNPLRYFARFARQPRLRLAWLLAWGRACWWAVFFVYGPILMVSTGLDAATAGAVISVGMCTLFLARLWGMAGRRFGIRRMLVAAYVGTGLVTIAVSFAAGLPWLVAALLIASAFAAGAIDGAGNVPFLRAVHAYERPEMTTVYLTYREAAQFTPPGLFAVLLQLIALPAVFAVTGAAMFALAWYSRYLPRRL